MIRRGARSFAAGRENELEINCLGVAGSNGVEGLGIMFR